MQHRTTIMLPRKLKARALKRAKERGLSFGELVRESLAAALVEAPARDALFADDAVIRGPGPRDLAAEHDRYLYDEPA